MEKGIRVEQVAKARENLRKEGIRACYFLQFGYPGETWEDIKSTVDLVRDTRPDDIGVSVAYPLPGTKFFQQVQAQLGTKTNWSDSEDLSMMFEGAYTGEFYRALHDALHAEVDSWNGRADGNRAGGNKHKNKNDRRELWDKVVQLEQTSHMPNPTKLDDSQAGSLVQLQLQSECNS
jgi:radical SAM superfamily enzyme YgiQ (UPF0313 family)